MHLRATLKWGSLAVFALFLAIQLVPYGWRHTNPAAHSEPPWDSPRTRELAINACYDCHSNRTEWPWYSYVAPVSWLIVRDVRAGREALNLSTWQREDEGEAEDLVEVVLNEEMPPWYYGIGHPGARLSESERLALARGLARTFGASVSSEEEKGNGRTGDD